jgi:hypothetical protein
MYWRLEGEDAMIVNTVHDSVIIDHDPELPMSCIAWEAMIEDVTEYVEKVYGRQLWVPLKGEYVTSPHWADYDEAKVLGTF